MLKEWLLSLVYPPRCPLCHASVPQHGLWCPDCTELYIRPRMLTEARHLAYLDGCLAVCEYSGSIRQMLHRLKYDGHLRMADAAQYALGMVPLSGAWKQIDGVVPVPLTPEKLHARGFNQAEVLFHPWAEIRWPWLDMLQRVRPTPAQWQLSRCERQQNMGRAFAVKSAFHPKGMNILLADDIFTTGATMDACAAALKAKGAASVTGIVIASGAM